jgi:hypothetical protein
VTGWDAPFGPLWYYTGAVLAGIAFVCYIRARNEPSTRAGLHYAVTWRVLAVLLVLGALTRLLALWR